MKRPVNYGKFGSKRGRPSKKDIAEMKAAELAAEAERKTNLPVYPMLTYDELREKFDVDIHDVDPATVTDINDIDLPEISSPYEWLHSWITQTGNPFLFKVDGIVVQLGGNLDPLFIQFNHIKTLINRAVWGILLFGFLCSFLGWEGGGGCV